MYLTRGPGFCHWSDYFRPYTQVGANFQLRKWILAGRVKVNGRVERLIYACVDLHQDIIELDDRPISSLSEKLYIRFHKPAGYLTTRTDAQNRPTIYDLLPSFATWVFPAGRLDMDSEGLLFLTNDGPLAEKLIRPDHHIVKTYEAQLNKPLQETDRL
ncbi:rRNA pseudouridine synthase [candidate division KSB1 bacterium]|nr:rRNA pseudouridine synthase [candidate division KSB1 bacterium]